jgi:hypothetical protein
MLYSNAVLKSLATSSTLKASDACSIVCIITVGNVRTKNYSHKAGSIVITLARMTLTILQAQSIRSQLDLLNKRTANCLNKRIYSHEASEAGSIVATIAVRLVATIVQPSCFLMASQVLLNMCICVVPIYKR